MFTLPAHEVLSGVSGSVSIAAWTFVLVSLTLLETVPSNAV